MHSNFSYSANVGQLLSAAMGAFVVAALSAFGFVSTEGAVRAGLLYGGGIMVGMAVYELIRRFRKGRTVK